MFGLEGWAGMTAGGASSLYANMLNTKNQIELQNQARNLLNLAKPLGEDLEEGYSEGGDILTALRDVGMLGAAKQYSDARTGAAADAWRFGGGRAGRTGGLLRDAQRLYSQNAGSAMSSANTAARDALTGMQTTRLGASLLEPRSAASMLPLQDMLGTGGSKVTALAKGFGG